MSFLSVVRPRSWATRAARLAARASIRSVSCVPQAEPSTGTPQFRRATRMRVSHKTRPMKIPAEIRHLGRPHHQSRGHRRLGSRSRLSALYAESCMETMQTHRRLMQESKARSSAERVLAGFPSACEDPGRRVRGCILAVMSGQQRCPDWWCRSVGLGRLCRPRRPTEWTKTKRCSRGSSRLACGKAADAHRLDGDLWAFDED